MDILNIEAPLIKQRKIFYLEGVRGLAAFMVCIHHFLLAFYPALFTGNVFQSHLNSNEIKFYSSPLIFLINGRLFVYVFFILSGYVLSKKTFLRNDIEYLNSAFVRRFPRLYIPVFVTLIIAFLCLRLNLNHNIEVSEVTKSPWLASLKGDPSIIKFLKNLIYRAMFLEDNSYVTVLWTISIEFYGSLLVFATMALISTIRSSYILLIVIFLVFCISSKFEYCAFVFGMSLNYLADLKLKSILIKRVLIVLLIITGLFLGGFPNVFELATPSLNGTLYERLNHVGIIKISGLLNCIGALCLVVAVFQSNLLQRFFSHRVLSFLGNISFSLYLLHTIVLVSFSMILFQFVSKTFSYNLSFIIVFISSMVFILITSYLMTIYVDKGSLTISSRLYKKYFAKP
jgi:peptidoglycan/LPS O-acetylase OafA/YrhL